MVEYSETFFGSSGVYLASFITGLTDVDAITLSVTRLAQSKQLSSDVAGIAVIIAALMNTVSKGAISYFSGTQELRSPVIKAFVLMILVGVISGWVVFFLF